MYIVVVAGYRMTGKITAALSPVRSFDIPKALRFPPERTTIWPAIGS